MECLFVFIGRENCAIIHEVGGKIIQQQGVLLQNYQKLSKHQGMQKYLSADVDERRACKWVLVSRRATTAALCH